MITPVNVGLFTPILFILCGVLLVVLRAGASRIFFDVVGTFQANKMLQDTEAAVTMMNAIMIDGLSGMEEAGAMVAEQMQKIVEATVPLSYELEKATIEFEKFINLSLDGGPALSSEVREVGLQFGFTAEQSLEAGARMAQLSSIIGQETVPQATEMALAFGLIGDMTPEAAMQKLINLQQQTGFIFKSTTKAAYDNLSADQKRLVVKKEMVDVLNTLNKVEDNSAATMSKITTVMNEFASQAHLAGESISMMAAMSATLIEAGEEQGKGGRALRMIYARLGADTGGAATTLQKLGVETKNADGSLRALSDVLADLNPKWQQMNSGQKQFIAQQVAGNRHYVRFIKLAENHDRILQLNNATTGTMGEVYSETLEPVGFLNDLMESEAIALDKARAELDLVNAAMGNFFIPTVVAATEYQTLFNEALLGMLEASHQLGGEVVNLGNMLQGFFEFQQIMTTTFAPFFSAMINVKAMNIALMTQRQIMRALSGVALAHTAQSKTAAQNIEISLEKENVKRKELIGLTNEQRLTEYTASNAAITGSKGKSILYQQHGVEIRELILLVGQQKTAETNLSAVQRQAGRYNAAITELETFSAERNIQMVGLNTTAHIKNTNTRKAHTLRVKEARAATDAFLLALEEEEMNLEQLNFRLVKTGEGYRFLINNVNGTTGAMKTVKPAIDLTTGAVEKQTMAIMALSMRMMKLGMGIFVAEMIVMMFKDALPGIKTESDAARISLILMAMGMAVMSAEMIYSMGAMVTATTVTKGATAAVKWHTFITGILTKAYWAQTYATIQATISVAWFKSVLMGVAFIASMIAIAAAINYYLVPKLAKLTERTDEAAESFEEFSDRTAGLAFNLENEMSGLDWSVFDEGTESIQGFNNAREEMFFGFKAGQVTGDLIKQVQQGGVGSFIANTEIIMTNTFNGMTTEEVADQIIEQIERKAGLSGLNASVAVN
jgi:TP901 family phage tail tape measure protein